MTRPEPARIESEGRVLELDAADIARVVTESQGMLGLLRSKTYLRARYKYPDADAARIASLAEAALGEPLGLAGAGRPPLAPASVTLDGRTWSFAFEELEGVDSALEQGSWLTAHVYSAAKARTGRIDAALELTAQMVRESVEAVTKTLEWHDQYMRWHDGDDGYTIF